MNLIDAVKSGKRFRRAGELLRLPSICEGGYYLSASDILATDWEIEERKIEITESEFDAACEEVRNNQATGYVYIDHLKKRLFAK